MNEIINDKLQNIIQNNCILFNCSQSDSVDMTLKFLNEIKLDYKKRCVDDLLLKIAHKFESQLKNNYERK